MKVRLIINIKMFSTDDYENPQYSTQNAIDFMLIRAFDVVWMTGGDVLLNQWRISISWKRTTSNHLNHFDLVVKKPSSKQDDEKYDEVINASNKNIFAKIDQKLFWPLNQDEAFRVNFETTPTSLFLL